MHVSRVLALLTTFGIVACGASESLELVPKELTLETREILDKVDKEGLLDGDALKNIVKQLSLIDKNSPFEISLLLAAIALINNSSYRDPNQPLKFLLKANELINRERLRDVVHEFISINNIDMDSFVKARTSSNVSPYLANLMDKGMAARTAFEQLHNDISAQIPVSDFSAMAQRIKEVTDNYASKVDNFDPRIDLNYAVGKLFENNGDALEQFQQGAYLLETQGQFYGPDFVNEFVRLDVSSALKLLEEYFRKRDNIGGLVRDIEKVDTSTLAENLDEFNSLLKLTNAEYLPAMLLDDTGPRGRKIRNLSDPNDFSQYASQEGLMELYKWNEQMARFSGLPYLLAIKRLPLSEKSSPSDRTPHLGLIEREMRSYLEAFHDYPVESLGSAFTLLPPNILHDIRKDYKGSLDQFRSIRRHSPLFSDDDDGYGGGGDDFKSPVAAPTISPPSHVISSGGAKASISAYERLQDLIAAGTPIAIASLSSEDLKEISGDARPCELLIQNLEPETVYAHSALLRKNVCSSPFLREIIDKIPNEKLRTAWKGVCGFDQWKPKVVASIISTVIGILLLITFIIIVIRHGKYSIQ